MIRQIRDHRFKLLFIIFFFVILDASYITKITLNSMRPNTGIEIWREVLVSKHHWNVSLGANTELETSNIQEI